MHLDVHQLQMFYYASALGRAAQHEIRSQLTYLWPPEECRDQMVVGFGFCNPLLRPYLEPAARVISLMPQAQGVMAWPAEHRNVAVLAEETLWPIETEQVDRLVLLHGLDTSDHPAAMLEECYRVLAPGGYAMVIVPSRTGLWARSEGTPFFYSRPYTLTQLSHRLADHGLQYKRSRTALYQPPWSTRFWLRIGPRMERIGRAIPAWRGGGVIFMEVSKQVPKPQRQRPKISVNFPLQVLQGVRTPQPS